MRLISEEDYESLAALSFAVQRQAEEWIGEMAPEQRSMLRKLVVEALMECLNRHGPRGQNHRAEMIGGYARAHKRLREQSETMGIPDHPEESQFPPLGPLGN